MHDSIFVLDSVIHALDYRTQGVIHEDGHLQRTQIAGFVEATARKGPPPTYLDHMDDPMDFEWANEMLFDRSETDVAVAQAVPLFGYFREALGPAEVAYRLSESNPSRILFCGAVDPLHQGLNGALAEMERQVEEWGSISFKFYQAQTPKLAWRADDPQLAYPLYEKAQELGIKMVQFHKGLPFGRQRVEDLRPNDIQVAAFDFPDLNFGLHHLGDPYIDETINIAARFENVYLVLPTLFNQYFVQPREMVDRLGKALFHCGDERICYGTDAVIWPHVQAYIDTMATLEMPSDLAEGYGYPEISRETRERIFGLNFARGCGIDLDPLRAAASARENSRDSTSKAGSSK